MSHRAYGKGVAHESVIWGDVLKSTIYGRRFEGLHNNGYPDICLTSRRIPIWVESKTANLHASELRSLKLRPEQAVWHHKWADGDGLSFIIAWSPPQNSMVVFDGADALRYRLQGVCFRDSCKILLREPGWVEKFVDFVVADYFLLSKRLSEV